MLADFLFHIYPFIRTIFIILMQFRRANRLFSTQFQWFVLFCFVYLLSNTNKKYKITITIFNQNFFSRNWKQSHVRKQYNLTDRNLTGLTHCKSLIRMKYLFIYIKSNFALSIAHFQIYFSIDIVIQFNFFALFSKTRS